MRSRRRAPRRRSSRSSCRGRRSRADRERPQALFTGTLEVAPRPRRRARGRQPSRSSRRGTVAFQHRHAAIGEGATLHWALAQLGGAARPLPRRQPPRGRPQHRSSRSRSCSARDDQLFDLTSYTRHIGRDTTGNLLSKGVLLDAARTLHEGPDHHRADRGRHRQLPRRVRDEPLEAGPRGRHPVARDRPAGLPPRRPLVARSARSTRPSCSTSRAAASRPTRRASSSSSASSSRSSRASRSPTAQDRLRELLEEKWAAGTLPRPPPTPRPPPALPVRRIDLARRRRGRRRRDEDGLGRRHRPGPRDQLGGELHARSRASAATSTSSSTRAS